MATYTCQTDRWVSTSPYVGLVIDVSTTATQATISYRLTYHAPNGTASATAAKGYSVTINGEVVNSGTCSINKKDIFDVCEGTVTIAKTKAKQTITCSCDFGFYLTWSGSYCTTKTAQTSVPIDAKTTYTITYNANGGAGAPAAQSKWHGEALTLSSTKPTRTGYSFQGWATSSTATTATYQPGASYSGNAAATLYAVWKANTYTVTYNANGGTGAPAAQTKTYGVTLTLSTTKPTRTGYTFKGWAMAATSNVIAYQPGGTYTANNAATLYAVWEQSYALPKIYNVSAEEYDPNERETDSNGIVKNFINVSFNCSTTYANPSCTISFYDGSGEITAAKRTVNLNSDYSSNKANMTSNTIVDIDKSYTIKITVTDSGGSSTATTTFTGNVYPIDFLAGGKGVSFGGAASLEDTAHFHWAAKFDKPVYGMVKGLGKLPKIEQGSDFNNFKDFGVWAVYGNADSLYIENMPPLYYDSTVGGMVGRAGILEVFSSTGEGLRSAEWSYIRQRFIPYSLSFPVMERDITRNASNAWSYGDWYITSGASTTLYDNSTGSTGTITLWENTANFEYLEIFFTDNNGELGGYTKIRTPYTKAVNLSIIEAGGTTTHIRRTSYTISGTTITPDTTNAGFVKLTGTVVSHTTGTNYIKITRVVGHRQ